MGSLETEWDCKGSKESSSSQSKHTQDLECVLGECPPCKDSVLEAYSFPGYCVFSDSHALTPAVGSHETWLWIEISMFKSSASFSTPALECL